MKKLYTRWGDRVHFLEVIVRQAHPGPHAPTYHTFGQKFEDARRYVEEEAIPWPVLVDDLEGTVHQVYGGMSDPTYLIGTDGRVSYYVQWTYVPALHQAIQRLFAQDGRGVVNEGINSGVHMQPALTTGWRGLRRGLPQSVIDMETAFPGTAVGTWIGYQMRPVLAPITQRARPLPRAAKVGLAVGAVGLAALAVSRMRRSSEEV